MGLRRQAREAALQALFMCDSLGTWDSDSAKFCLEHFNVPEQVNEYALSLCKGVIENLPQVDSHISCASEHWSLARMARVDRSLLRLATFEIAWCADVPVNVSIDEAIEIAKRFGADSSPLFVNGVLDRVATTLRDKVEIENVPSQEEEEVVSPPAAKAALDAAATDSSE
ncbi:MAG: transcription antitermination factor NusB [Bdellovibrionales bacterium]|nr:transcription antitermination factor NusB [Bdellovibrionales bacterium]